MVFMEQNRHECVLLGLGGAGKTTVAEALAYLTGVTKRMGKVADGNTISDYDKEEIKRQFLDLHYNGSDRVRGSRRKDQDQPS